MPIFSENTIPPDCSSVLTAYLEEVFLKGRSDRSIAQYRKILTGFIRQTSVSTFADISYRKLVEYLSFITSVQALSLTTRQNYHTILVSFFEWCITNEHGSLTRKDLDRFRQLRPIGKKKRAQVPYAMIGAFLEDMLKDRVGPSSDEPLKRLCWLRQRAIYAVLFSTALRASELCRLNRSDLEADEILVRTKGDKEHIVYLSPIARSFCYAYLLERKDTDPALFVTHGSNRPTQRLTYEALHEMVKKDADYYGIPLMTPHKFRHLAAQRFLEETDFNMELVRQFLGHSNISTTQQNYAHVQPADLKKAIKKHHPAFR
jgi:site-specific recombinase XerD